MSLSYNAYPILLAISKINFKTAANFKPVCKIILFLAAKLGTITRPNIHNGLLSSKTTTCVPKVNLK